ncbi:DUF6916 family protein [Roseivivax lentus]|nr:hypothetical protein [Roseivivax lentus]
MDGQKSLSLQDFTDLVDDTFTVSFGETTLEARLVEAKAMGTGLREGGAFSLLWQGPAEPALVQATYEVAHAATGPLDIFLVPVARNDDGYCYEAVFT